MIIREGKGTSGDNNNADESKVAKMKWPMGEKEEESVEVVLPVEVIRDQGKDGSDIAITLIDGVVFNGTGA